MSYYNKEEQEVINDWLVSVGAPYLANEDFKIGGSIWNLYQQTNTGKFLYKKV